MTLTLERTEIKGEEVAKGVLSVENVSDQPVEINAGDCEWGYALYQKGAYAAGIVEPPTCTAVPKNYTISPGEVQRYPVAYNAFGEADPNRQFKRDPLPPGPYDAVAGIYAQNDFWYAPPVRLTIRA